MKSFRKLCSTFTFLLLYNICLAQRDYPIAITSDGILLGEFKETIDTRNTIPAPISIEQAKGIFALNVIYIDGAKHMSKFKVKEYLFTIYEKGDTTRIGGMGEMLSESMRYRLDRIKPGAIINFEGIKCEIGDATRAGIFLSFVVE